MVNSEKQRMEKRNAIISSLAETHEDNMPLGRTKLLIKGMMK